MVFREVAYNELGGGNDCKESEIHPSNNLNDDRANYLSFCKVRIAWPVLPLKYEVIVG